MAQLNTEVILIVGDGNFSFSLSYAIQNPGRLVVASVLEANQAEFVNRYGPISAETLQNLYRHSNVQVCFGVDATDPSTVPRLPYKEIIFNFPHQGGKSNIKKSRALMREVFTCMSSVMENSTILTITLAPKQGEISVRGTSVDVHSAFVKTKLLETSFYKHKMDSWTLLYLAAESGLICGKIDPFNPDDYLEYKASGYKKTNTGFHNERATMFRFSLENAMVVNIPREHINYLLPYYIHHFSFLFLHPKEEETSGWNDLVRNVLFEYSTMIVSMRELDHLRNRCIFTNLPNRIFEIIWQSPKPEGKSQNVITVDRFREWLQNMKFRDFMLI